MKKSEQMIDGANPGADASDSGMFSLLHAAQRLQDRIESAMESVGLSWAKYGVVSVLLEAGEPLPLGELAGRVRCVRSNMTQLIDRLEADELVQRTNDPSDRRVVRAELTPLGQQRAEAGAEQLKLVQSDFASLLSDAERTMIDRVLAALC